MNWLSSYPTEHDSLGEMSRNNALDKKGRLGFQDNLSNEKFILFNRFIRHINNTSLWIVCGCWHSFRKFTFTAFYAFSVKLRFTIYFVTDVYVFRF